MGWLSGPAFVVALRFARCGKVKGASTMELVRGLPALSACGLAVRDDQVRIDDGAGFLVPSRFRLAVLAVREDQVRIDDGVGFPVTYRRRLAVPAALTFVPFDSCLLPENSCH
jgi:hypothetical protein